MSNPFESARRQIARAKDHIAELESEISEFINKNPGEYFTEPDTKNPENTVHKVRLKDDPIPIGLSEIAGDAIGNLRESLDHAVYGIAIAAGCKNPRNAYFPFSGKDTDFENNLRGRCKDVPEEVYPLFRRLKPYRGGNQVLFALNQVGIRNKHTLLVSMGAVTFDGGQDISGMGYFSMPTPHIWDSTKNEMELFTLGPGAKFEAHLQFGFAVAFSEIEGAEGFPALSVMGDFLTEVESIVSFIEEEARRLKYFS
jgi:hypothetical protein